MNCERFRDLLDAYIDGELDADAMRQFMDHADACENCRNELREAEMLRDMMKDLDDDVAVPLQVQAAWRNAVRTEAKKRRSTKIVRVCCGIAAAFALFVGVNFAMNTAPEVKNETLEAQPMMMRSAVTGADAAALIARDGSAVTTAAAGDESYTAMKKIETDAFDEACRTIGLLCEEYTGTISADESASEGEKRSKDYRIELPYEYMADFLTAASRIGAELHSEVNQSAGDRAIILIQLSEK